MRAPPRAPWRAGCGSWRGRGCASPWIVAPSNWKGFRALTLHLTGVTDEMRQRFRDEVLATDRASFSRLATALRAKPFKVAIFGAKEALEQANEKRGPEEQIEITQLS